MTHPTARSWMSHWTRNAVFSANLEMLFRKAAKGERGLKIVAQREQLLLDELNRLQGEQAGFRPQQRKQPETPLFPVPTCR